MFLANVDIDKYSIIDMDIKPSNPVASAFSPTKIARDRDPDWAHDATTSTGKCPNEKVNKAVGIFFPMHPDE
jgi:hypothetical protein